VAVGSGINVPNPSAGICPLPWRSGIRFVLKLKESIMLALA